MIRRGLALLAVGGLFACNAIIGLGQPSVNDTDGGDADQPDAEPGSDAPVVDETSSPADASSRPDASGPPVDASDAGDSTLSSDVGPPDGPQSGDATMIGPPLVYIVNATQIPGIEICLGVGTGTSITIGNGPPYPQHLLQPAQCEPLTCAEEMVGCGPAPDGCGNLLQCGTCTSPETCGGSGLPGQCGLPGEGGMCLPLTCQQQNLQCGSAGDGCGNVIQCGSCPTGQTCIAGQCGAAAWTGGLLSGTGIEGPSMAAYTGTAVTGFVIPASLVAPNVPCNTLLGADGLGGTLDAGSFYRAGTAPAGSFEPGTATLVAFWGCPPGLADGGTCGMSYESSTGNVTATVFTQPPMAGPGEIEILPVHVATALDCLMPGCPMGSSELSLVWPGGMTALPLVFGMPGMQVALPGFEQDASAAIVQNPQLQAPLSFSFDDIARSSNNGSANMPDGAPYFASGQAYFLVTVGDPLVAADASPNGAFHLIGAPLTFPPDPSQ